jgi:AcrR family transcriptional regulator
VTAADAPAGAERAGAERAGADRAGADRAGRIRRALIELVAEHGLYGTGMSAVAKRAGVGTGTAYVYYPSKEALLLDAYREVKLALGAAVTAGVDPDAAPADRFRRIWTAVYRHLAADPARARFLVQVDHSPLAAQAHALVLAGAEDPLVAAAGSADLRPLLAELELELLYDLGLAPAVRLAATRPGLVEAELDVLATACWRAITRG